MSQSPAPSAELASIRARPLFAGVQWLLFILAAWYFFWPVYRSFLNVEIQENEGWNAYFADAALGRMPLYPSKEKLITNNYPPLSFYIVGGAGRVLGDPILAGRLISLASILVVGSMVFAAVRGLGGDRAGAGVGGALLVATISHFCEPYAGMDDPQLLAQAIMAVGFVWFLRREAKGGSCLAPILLMGLAGFVKHNIIAMPLTAFLWLGFHRPGHAVKCAVVSAAAVALGFGLCFALYGRDFFANLLYSRQYSWARSLHAAEDLKSLIAGLAAFAALGWFRWRDRGFRLCLLFILVALGSDFLQRTGAGVDLNAAFDLIVAVCMGTGLAFSHAAQAPSQRFFSAGMLRGALILAICMRFLVSQIHDPNRPFRLFFDPSFKHEIAVREKAMAAMIAKIQATPGAVMCTNYACYRAGKPFVVDKFNANQRMLTGALPRHALKSMIASHQVTEVGSDPRGDWGESMRKIADSPGESF